MGSEVDFAVTDPEFPPDVVPVRINGTYGKIQDFSNLFCAPALFHKIGHMDLRGRESMKLI